MRGAFSRAKITDELSKVNKLVELIDSEGNFSLFQTRFFKNLHHKKVAAHFFASIFTTIFATIFAAIFATHRIY